MVIYVIVSVRNRVRVSYKTYFIYFIYRIRAKRVELKMVMKNKLRQRKQDTKEAKMLQIITPDDLKKYGNSRHVQNDDE